MINTRAEVAVAVNISAAKMEKNNTNNNNSNESSYCTNRYDKIFNVFYQKYKLGVFAYDLPCQHLRTNKREIQCRSSDELATIKFFCLDCETFIE